MKSRLSTIVLAVAIALTALLLKDFVRNGIVIPLLEVLQLIDDLPRMAIWLFFIGIMLIPAYTSLKERGRPAFRTRLRMKSQLGRIETLASLIRKARMGDYFRERLSRYLGELALETLAYRERLPLVEIKNRLRSGSLDLPPEIRSYLQAGLLGDYSNYQENKLSFFRSEGQTSPLDLDPIRVVKFLEQQLEAYNGIQDQ